MSNHNSARDVRVTPQYDHWLGVIASSMLPPVAAFFAPAWLQLPLFGLAAVLFAAGLVMLWKSTQRERVRSGHRSTAATQREEPSLTMEGAEP